MRFSFGPACVILPSTQAGLKGRRTLMRKSIVLAAALAATPLLSGCLVADVAGAAIGLTTATVSMVGGAAVDLVTTDEDERQQQEIDQLKRDNEELRRQQQASSPG